MSTFQCTVWDWWQREALLLNFKTFKFCPFSHFNSLWVKDINSHRSLYGHSRILFSLLTVVINACLPCKENKIIWAMFSSRFHLTCNSTEAVRALTYKCSKCIWGQFLEDDWVGGPVSLENLRETKMWCYFLLSSLMFAHLVSNVYLWPQGALWRTYTILNVQI